MRKFTLDDYNKVKDYEKDFDRAINSRYATGLTKEELDTVQVIYNQTLNRQANLNCGGCVLQMMTAVGRLYYGFKKDYEKELEEQARKAVMVQEVEVKPKRKRRKKNEEEVKD